MYSKKLLDNKVRSQWTKQSITHIEYLYVVPSIYGLWSTENIVY